MKRVLILCLFLTLSTSSARCATNLFPPLQPIKPTAMAQTPANRSEDYTDNSVTSFADPYANSQNTNYPAISKIENSLFGQSYVNQNISLRLSRIEKDLFSTTYPNSSPAQRIENIILNFNQINKYPNISSNVLSGIENKIFNQRFSQNSAKRRIERLEEQMFGAVQSGDLQARYETIKLAAKRYNNPDKYYTQAPTQTGWRGIGGGLRNAMSGSMTGFTPSISPFNYGYNNSNNSYGYNPYMNMGANGMNSYYGTRSPFGYSDTFQNFGTQSGTGVTILD